MEFANRLHKKCESANKNDQTALIVMPLRLKRMDIQEHSISYVRKIKWSNYWFPGNSTFVGLEQFVSRILHFQKCYSAFGGNNSVKLKFIVSSTLQCICKVSLLSRQCEFYYSDQLKKLQAVSLHWKSIPLRRVLQLPQKGLIVQV